jgi:regulatory protein
VLETGDRVRRALELAYRQLNRREQTISEMRRHLARRGIEDEAVDGAIEELTEQGYLDDARYARLFAEDKRALEQWGSDRIKRSLQDRGIELDVIEASLTTDVNDSDHDRALELLIRRFPSPPRDRRERDRALGLLIRKGYDSDLALEVLAAYSRGAERPDLQ